MSFETQPSGHCGVCSLRFAVSLLGIGWHKGEELTVPKLREFFRKSRLEVLAEGVDEDEIARAAARLGLQTKAHVYRRITPDRFMADLRAATERGHIAITTWHDDDRNHFHWVCVGGFTEDGRVLLFDPATIDDNLSTRVFDPVGDPRDFVPGFMSEKRFREWMVPEAELDGADAHFFLELWPAKDSQDDFVKGRITAELLEAMRRDDELITYYDEYVDDLRDIFGAPSSFHGGEPAYEFLERHRDDLQEMMQRWTLAESCPKGFRRLELDSLVALARCYDFRVRTGGEAAAMRELGFHLGWRCCERSYDVGRYD